MSTNSNVEFRIIIKFTQSQDFFSISKKFIFPFAPTFNNYIVTDGEEIQLSLVNEMSKYIYYQTETDSYLVLFGEVHSVLNRDYMAKFSERNWEIWMSVWDEDKKEFFNEMVKF